MTRRPPRTVDLLARVRGDIDRRKTELGPAVDEVRKLQAALAALNGKGPGK